MRSPFLLLRKWSELGERAKDVLSFSSTQEERFFPY